MFLKHGHLIVVFFLVSRYQSEQDQSRKTKLMGFGMVLVIAWMFLTPYIKTKRLGLEYKGVRVYEQISFERDEIIDKIIKYEEESVFGLDPIQEEPNAKPKSKV